VRISKFLATTSLVAIAVAASSRPWLQTPAAADAADGPALEEVVVTAQKRTENLQDTPISVSVLSAKAMEDRHVGSLWSTWATAADTVPEGCALLLSSRRP